MTAKLFANQITKTTQWTILSTGNHREPTQSVCVTDVIMVNVLYLPFASSVAVYRKMCACIKAEETLCYLTFSKLWSFCLRSGILR